MLPNPVLKCCSTASGSATFYIRDIRKKETKINKYCWTYATNALCSRNNKRTKSQASAKTTLRKMISLSKTHYIKSLKEKSTLRKKRLRSLRRKSKRVLFISVLFAIRPCIKGLFRYLRKVSTKLKLARYLITWFVVLTENSVFA